MHPTLFPDYFSSNLQNCVGILSKPLEILHQVLASDYSTKLIESVRADQKELADRRRRQRNPQSSGCGVGSKTMKAEVVMAFTIARGLYPDIYGERGFEILKESKSLIRFLVDFNISKFPSRSSVHEHVSNLSKDTLLLFNKTLLKVILDEGFDDFSCVTLDSTAIEADSPWPVDSQILQKLSNSLLVEFLSKWENFTLSTQRKIPVVRLKNYCGTISDLNREINFCRGQKNAAAKRKRLYKKLFNQVERFLNLLDSLTKRADDFDLYLDFSSSFCDKYQKLDDKLLTSQRRFGINTEPIEGNEPKIVLSVSDPDASIIEKGDREKTFGYRPNFGISSQGFITAFSLQAGNTNDRKSFPVLLQSHQALCGCIPLAVSTDNGYASKKNFEYALEQGAQIVSFSGSTGKKVLGEEIYELHPFKNLRRNRSAVEGTISNLKNVRNLKRFSVRNADSVERE